MRLAFDRTTKEQYLRVKECLGLGYGTARTAKHVGVSQYTAQRIRGGDIPISAAVEESSEVGEIATQIDPKLYRSFGLVGYEYKAGNKLKVILGKFPRMLEVFEDISRIAGHNVHVLVIGETGTGKELVAEAIHYSSDRAKHPYVGINCSAFPEGLLESELFGHVEGSFTGAIRDRRGVFRIANSGSLFLDEVGQAPLTTQTKLLKAVENGKIRPVGHDEEKDIETDTRIIAATNQDLRNLIVEGRFREDLFYRLNGYEIVLPPLRERGYEEIEALARYFLECYARLKGVQKEFAPDAIEEISKYKWPGNVRELNAIVRKSVIVSGDKVLIEKADVGGLLQNGYSAAIDNHPPKSELNGNIDDAVSHITNHYKVSADEVEVRLIAAAMRKFADLRGGDVWGIRRLVSEELDISPRTLCEKIRKYGISPDGKKHAFNTGMR